MRTIVLPVLASVCVASSFAAEAWLTDLDEAKKVAAQENKDILIEFTGSDWCPPCMKMRADVLTKEDFIKPASEKFVLVELDYPKTKKQAQDVRIKNRQLAEQYGIKGFPTVIFADAQARPFGMFIGGRDMNGINEEMKVALEAKENVLNAVIAAEAATTDEEKLETIAKLLQAVPETLAATFYKPQKDLLISLDKDDKYGAKKAVEQEQAMSNFIRLTASANANGDTDDVLFLLTEYLDNTPNLLPVTKQKGSILLIRMLLEKGEVDQALAKLDEAVSIAPNSDSAKELRMLRCVIEENKDKFKAAAQQTSSQTTHSQQ